MPAVPLPSTRDSYWHESRSARYSLSLALPLLLLYEVLAAAMTGVSGGVRNGADVMLKSAFVSVLGARGPLVFEALLIATMLALIFRDARKKSALRASTFLFMFGESLVLAMVFGVAVGLVTAQILSPLALAMQQSMGLGTSLMVSLGAGLYEELLFRVLLVGALLWGSKHVLGWGPVTSGTFAVVTGALIFSAFHYIGPYGDPFTLPSFTFRAVAGLAFSGLYVLRGFGITAWTHALYDVLLMIARA